MVEKLQLVAAVLETAAATAVVAVDQPDAVAVGSGGGGDGGDVDGTATFGNFLHLHHQRSG